MSLPAPKTDSDTDEMFKGYHRQYLLPPEVEENVSSQLQVMRRSSLRKEPVPSLNAHLGLKVTEECNSVEPSLSRFL